MANTPITKISFGGLDTDSGLQLVAKEDYIDGFNLQNVNKDGQNIDIEIAPLRGNEKAFYLEAPYEVQTGKTYSIFIPNGFDFSALPAGDYFKFKAFAQNGINIIDANADAPAINTVQLLANFIEAQIILTGVGFTNLGANVTYDDAITGNLLYQARIDIEIVFPNRFLENYTIQIEDLTTGGIAPFVLQIKREAIGDYLANRNKLQIIGRYNIERELFMWVTPITERKFPSINVFDMTDVSSLLLTYLANTRVETSVPHGLTSGMEVFIESELYPHSNGIWTIVVISATEFDLVNSGFSAFVTASGSIGSVSRYVSPIGAIYHAKRGGGFAALEKWTPNINNLNGAKPLIVARDLNFITKFQIDCIVKSNNIQTKFKFTDNNNPYRYMIYRGDYKTMGFIYDPIDNPDGVYTFEGLNEASKMIIGDINLKLSVEEVIGGGQLTTKNYVYYAALLNDGFSRTPWSLPTNPISIISADTTDNSLDNVLSWNGNVSAEPTNKATRILVENIPQGAYKFLEIGVIEYRFNSFRGYKLSRIPLASNETSKEVLHLGGEVDRTDLDTIELNRLYANITKGLNLVEIDNRSAISNVYLSVDPDLSAWAKQIQYSVKRKDLQKSGLLTDAVPLTFGEYQLVDNIVNYTGYGLFDTVRLGICLKLRGQSRTLAYWIDDVKIDNSGASGQRQAGLPNPSLTSDIASYAFYIEATNIDWDYKIPETGERLRDIVESAYFVREPVNTEILASGFILLSEQDGTFPFRYNPAYDGTTYTPTTDSRKRCFFYSPDTNVSNAEPLRLLPGDKLVVLAQSTREPIFTATTGYEGYEFRGDHVGYSEHEIEYFANLFDETSGLLAPGIVAVRQGSAPGSRYSRCYALEVDSDILPISGLPDYGVYTAFYVRPKANLYPSDVTLSRYIPINGVEINPSLDTQTTVYDIFGGDTFTRRNFLLTKERPSDATRFAIGFYSQGKRNTQLSNLVFPGNFVPTGTIDAKYTAYVTGQDDFSFTRYDVSFNIRNSINQIGAYDSRQIAQQRAAATVYWSEQAFEDSAQSNDQYFLPLNNRALDLSNGEIVHMVVLNDILYTLQPKRTERQYFDNTNQLRAVDGSEILLGTGAVMGTKGAFKSTYGCVHKWSVVLLKTDGGRDSFMYLDALTRKIVRVGEDGTVVISDRAKLANWTLNNTQFTIQHTTPADNYGVHGGWDEKNRQAVLTSRCYRKENSSWVEGAKYPEGWIVTNNQFYGYDGQPVLYVCLFDVPSTEDNEPGVGRFWEDVWQRVSFDDNNYYNWWTLVWSEIDNKFKWWISPKPKIWLPYQETILSPNPSPYSPVNYYEVWEHTEKGNVCEWYCYMLFFDSVSSTQLSPNQIQFSVSIYTVLPNISFWADDYTVYLEALDGGGYVQIIELNTNGTIVTLSEPNDFINRVWTIKIVQRKQAYIENVLNENDGIKVKFVATQYNMELPPTKVEYETNQHVSYLDESDFEQQDEYHQSSIKFDTTNNPNNNQADASMLFGKYLKIKTYLGFDILQRLNSFVVKVKPLNRLIQK